MMFSQSPTTTGSSSRLKKNYSTFKRGLLAVIDGVIVLLPSLWRLIRSTDGSYATGVPA